MKKQELRERLNGRWRELREKGRLFDFYKASEINLGSVNTPEHIDTVSEWLREGGRFEELKESLSNMPLAKRGRKTSYDYEHGLGISALITSREEEVIAYSMYNECAESEADSIIEGVGRILNYQVPLKSDDKDKEEGINEGVGKIDLVSYKDGFIYIIELKQPKSKESLLRCILESYTYARSIKREQFVADFARKTGDPNAAIGICAMFFKGEWNEGKKQKRVKIRAGEEYELYSRESGNQEGKGKYANLRKLIGDIEKDLSELNGVETKILFCPLDWERYGMRPYFCER